MRITKADVIKSGERELIDSITADLDWSVVEEIFKKYHNLAIEEEVEYKQGDLIVHENRVAYKLDFDIKVRLSIVIDREGNYLSITHSGDRVNPLPEAQAPEEPPVQKPEQTREIGASYEAALLDMDSENR
ncbi:MAG: hypothetical protein EHM45_03315 [Desulfobacteraceae bacterium]|nr:MAG: hypothetical protein EHM45_03315 [Desulfobacteraceae bacterium]